jgi:lysophospholipase L1-like esterase
MAFLELLAVLTAFGLAFGVWAGDAKDLSKGGTLLLLGDSILDSHAGDKRIEAVLKRVLEKKAPQAKWTIVNAAHGGQYIGPQEGSPKGTSGPLFTTETTGGYFDTVKKHPKADAVLINFGANDGKVYPPATFRKRLEALCALLQKDYPGAVIIFSTGMYLDPKHSGSYWRDDVKVPGFKNGSSRNLYLEPYNKEARELAAAKGFLVADTYQRIEAETQKGNWDFRIRAGNGDPKDDPKHEGDMNWFGDIHPNDRGTELLAEVYADVLTAKTSK